MAYLNLKGEMAKRDITTEKISNLLNLHRNSVSNKLKGLSSFSIDEAMKVKDAYFPDCAIEELFKKD